MARYIRRRKFLATLGGAAVAWPLAARAQQTDRMRHIGVLMAMKADDPEYQARMTAFLQELAQLGWIDGLNARIDTCWGVADADRIRKYAAELVALAPDVIWVNSSAALAPLLQATRTVLCSQVSPIRLVPASLIAWRNPAATPLALPCSNTASARNGWNCSKRFHPA